MVLSLPTLSKSSASPRSPRRASESGQHHPALPASDESKQVWKSSTTLGLSPNIHSTTLGEALRNNPFGSTSRSRASDALASQADERNRELEELNMSLETLTRIFPDVKIEVFRELLVRFDGESRLHVCVEQLLRHKAEWVAGRWNVPDRQESNTPSASRGGDGNSAMDDANGNWVPPDERFRTAKYKAFVRAALSKEFSSLSKSTIDAVLAEVNFSYARARPTLRDLSRKTWRATLHNILPSFKRKKDKGEHPLLLWQRQADGELVPRLKETGCEELDRELHEDLLAPLLLQKKEEQERRDFHLAEELNHNEAKEAEALYECECCFDDVPFEQISTCSTSTHVICFNCIRRTLHEALFGQGWSMSVDTEKSTLRCIAPLSNGSCDGSLPSEIVKRAVFLDRAGSETYRKFEDRLASETLMRSHLKLVRCPFCSYAEADSVYHLSPKGISWHFRRYSLLLTILMAFFLLDLIPVIMIFACILLLLNPRSVVSVFQDSLRNLCLKTRPKRFICANPSCRRTSCITCQKPWRDPHVCHEPQLLDLRTTVEAARTAAVKRTCPRCGLSFVKSSGCNKLTCFCGYSMCYVCRKALGPPLETARRRLPERRLREDKINTEGVPSDVEMEEEPYDDDDDDEEAPEGYQHFCEHFRVNPGSRCTECNKCDLYEAVDEEDVARRAGEKAEREWRLRQGAAGAEIGSRHINSDLTMALNLQPSVGDGRRRGRGMGSRGASSWADELTSLLAGRGNGWKYWFWEVWCDGRWKLEGQALVDFVVEHVVVIDGV